MDYMVSINITPSFGYGVFTKFIHCLNFKNLDEIEAVFREPYLTKIRDNLCIDKRAVIKSIAWMTVDRFFESQESVNYKEPDGSIIKLDDMEEIYYFYKNTEKSESINRSMKRIDVCKKGAQVNMELLSLDILHISMDLDRYIGKTGSLYLTMGSPNLMDMLPVIDEDDFVFIMHGYISPFEFTEFARTIYNELPSNRNRYFYFVNKELNYPHTLAVSIDKDLVFRNIDIDFHAIQ